MGEDERHDVPEEQGGGRRQEKEVGHLAVNGPLTAGLVAGQFWMGRG